MIIVAMRDPDASNEFQVFAEGQPEPQIIDVDYGYADLRDLDEFSEWYSSHYGTVVQLRKLGTPNARAAADFLQGLIDEAVGNYGHDGPELSQKLHALEVTS